MEENFKINLLFKNNYSFGHLNSGFRLLDFIYLENLSGNGYHGLNISVKSTHDLRIAGDCVVSFVAPFSAKMQSCDFVTVDPVAIAELNAVTDVCISVVISDCEGNVLEKRDFSCRFLPHDYFSGLMDMPESLAFLVTPDQEDLAELMPTEYDSDCLPILFERIKSKKIRYLSEDFSGILSARVRLPERVLRECNGNSLEVSLLFASVCERANLNPFLIFEGKGKVFVGFSKNDSSFSLITEFIKNRRDLEEFSVIDSGCLVYGSELGFQAALDQSKNALLLSDEKILMLHLKSARELGIFPLPNRLRNGLLILDETRMAQNAEVEAALKERRVSESDEKFSVGFCSDLDVNQNKILSKILSRTFTLIRAQYGSGTSALFAKAACLALKEKKSVLYLTDPNYHPECFFDAISEQLDPSFVFRFSEFDCPFNAGKTDGKFEDFDEILDYKAKVSNFEKEMDRYYENLEGNRRIVSSFQIASDRYHQLRSAPDGIIFSPEQIGSLSDEAVQLWFNSVNELVKSFTEVGNISAHPLLLIKRKNFSYEFKSKLIQSLEALLHCTRSILDLREQISPYFLSVPELKTYHGFYAFLDLIRLFSDFETVPKTFFENPVNIEEHFRNITQLIQAKKENESIFETVQISFQKSIFDLDAIELYSRYEALQNDKSLKAISQKYVILKSVKKHLKPNCDIENIEFILSRLFTYQKNDVFLKSQKEAIFHLLSISFEQEERSWEALQVAADLCYQAYSVFHNNFSIEKLSEFVSEFVKASASSDLFDKLLLLREQSEEYVTAKENFDELVGNQIDFYYSGASLKQNDYFSVVHQELTSVFLSADQVKNWCNWLTIRDNALQLGMKNVVNAIESDKVSAQDLKRSFLKAFFRAICEYNFIQHPELIPDGTDINARSLDFLNDRECLRALQRKETNSLLSLYRSEYLILDSSDYPTYGSLLQNDFSTFQKLFPCFVADLSELDKLLSCGVCSFDYVFVESRRPVSTEDFLNVLSIGKKVSFAGNFDYTSNSCTNAKNKDSVFDFLWKTVDEKYSLSAVYGCSPNLSRIRSWFAGALRSDSRLYSVPPTKRIPAANWIRVLGSYGDDWPRANLVEAEQCVSSLMELREEGNQDTVSILTATLEQKNLVLKILAKKVSDDPYFQNRLTKNGKVLVSSVQEPLPISDHVIFSATFAPNRSYHATRLPYFALEFGNPDPKKLLFEILSSGKKSVQVITSFGFEDLQFTQTVLPSVSAFYLMLTVLSNAAKMPLYESMNSQPSSSVLRELNAALAERGFRTESNVQSGRFFFDLAIFDPDRDHALGIISDQTVMNQKSNVASIEIANRQLYQKHGWTVYRLRSTKTFDSYDQVLEEVTALLQPEEKDRGLF